MAPDRRIALVSVSIDLGAGRRGVDMGPSALRIAGISSRVEALGYQIREFGTVTAGGFETTDPGPERETRFLEEIAQVADRAAAMVREALDEGCLPLILGGDHSLSIGTVGAVAAHHRSHDASVGVIWVDAHTDMNTPESTPSGNIHGAGCEGGGSRGAPAHSVHGRAGVHHVGDRRAWHRAVYG